MDRHAVEAFSFAADHKRGPIAKAGGGSIPRPAQFAREREGVREFLAQMALSGAAADFAVGGANATLALAVIKLEQHAPEAISLFASVVRVHDVREGWIGLAIAHYFQDEIISAGIAIAHALCHHAVASVPPIVNAITETIGAPGWCALDHAGSLTARLSGKLRGHLSANLDGKPLLPRSESDDRVFTCQLPDLWWLGRELRVTLDNVNLLGSPVDLRKIARVEGFADSRRGDLHGWAWCPNDPDYDPVLSIVSLSRGNLGTVVAVDPVRVVTQSALVRARGFLIPADALSRFEEPVRIVGRDRRDLTGSPLDPSTERRSAETAARIVAARFRAPGQEESALRRDVTLMSVPAHVMGGPVAGGYKKRPVEVVIPVYGKLDLTLACLRSVLNGLPAWARVVVVDDGSPDPRVAEELRVLATAGRITLLGGAVNQGFPGAANLGMRHDAECDVVLLNSDTLTPPGWLASLREAAYSAPDIGSATPLSNDATILSYPSVGRPNPVPNLGETIRLNALARKANDGCVVDVPVAVGFCVYIKRDCLNATGLLREDVFAQGYGEENDFCLRGRHLGWRHVAVPSVFVGHVGGQSFGTTKQYLIERNTRKLNELHPGYDALITEFQSADPLAEPRRRLDLARWKTFRTRAHSVLLVTHDRIGGVRHHVVNRAGVLAGEGLRAIMLWPAAAHDGEGLDCILGNGPEGGTPNLRFSIPAELDMLTRILKSDRPVRAEVHHLAGHDHRLLDLFQRLAIPYDIVVHDYSWLCPRINLVGSSRHYCGEPDIAGCETCVANGDAVEGEAISPRALRQRSAIEMTEASAVVVSSADVAIRVRRHFPTVEPKVVSWEDDRSLPPAHPAPISLDGMRRVCVVGGIGIEKGYDVLLACARDVAERNLNLRFCLVGHSCDDARLTATGHVDISGWYEEHDVVRLIRQQRAQLAWLPAVCPETWSYTLTQAWQAGLNVLAFDIGAPAERIRQAERGWLCPLGLSPQALNARMLSLRPTEPDKEPPLFPRRLPCVRSV
jgi:GT2 family glycosyltransferase